MITSCFSLRHMEQKLIIPLFWIWVLIIYQAKDIFQEFWTKGISLVQSLSRVWLFVTPLTAACQGPCPSPTPRVHANPCPLSQWCHPTISFSAISFSSWSQSLPASGSSQMSQLFASVGQSIGVSASTSVLPGLISFRMDWFSLQSKGLSRVFSNTTVQKHQFFSTQLSS